MATRARKPTADKGARLDERVKLFIVQQLACFDTPSQVAEMVAEEFGVKITRMHVSKYQVGTAAADKLSDKWVAVFKLTREQFIKNSSEIPCANKSYRLRTLQKMIGKALERGNAALVAQLLEQAAKEEGGAFTNRRELSGPNGKPMQTQIGTITRRVVDPVKV